MAETGTLARPYARAVFQLARADGSLSNWSQALGTAATVVVDPAARRFLARRELDDDARVEFLLSVCAGAGAGEAKVLESTRGRNFLRLLVENNRLPVLPEIAEQFEALKARAENTVKVQLVTAASVAEPVVQRIKSALEQRLGRAVELELEQDPGLLGGAVIHAEGRVIDASVRNRLAELAGTLTA